MGRKVRLIDRECVDKTKMDIKDVGDLGVLVNRLQEIVLSHKNGGDCLRIRGLVYILK